MLIASMNPCPCGYYTHPKKACSCTPLLRKRYIGKISGPLLDRIDIHLSVNPVSWDDMKGSSETTDSRSMKEKVARARQRQAERFAAHKGVYSNSMMSPKLVQSLCELPSATDSLLNKVMKKLNLSARAYTSIRKVARTIADLAESEHILENHVGEAVLYRSLDRDS